MSKCVNCEVVLEGSQRDYCSNRCKQALKYAIKKGERCAACKKKMKPVPVLGGYKKHCDRKKCIQDRGV